MMGFKVIAMASLAMGPSLLARLSSNDPTSLFFDPVDAFRSGYFARRRAHANKSLQQIGPAPGRTAITDPELCVGIVDMHKEGDFLRSSGVSFLDGLSAEERDGVHLEALFAATAPGTHSAYNPAWLCRGTNRVLTYEAASEEERAMP
ncbi:hypothetical protein WHR41_09329 [Cladosporium halotolerans]|uniref:Uncharacterized protein n=1 Tax=Cladosporium halotolerans TaxID=1052096 RepID=A0AB34KEH3_9PEZI